jgi:hypothetical protein
MRKLLGNLNRILTEGLVKIFLNLTDSSHEFVLLEKYEKQAETDPLAIHVTSITWIMVSSHTKKMVRSLRSSGFVTVGSPVRSLD